MKFFDRLVYRYRITMPYDKFIDLPLIDVYNLKKEEEIVSFLITNKTFIKHKNELLDGNIQIKDLYLKLRFLILKKYLIMLLFLIMMSIIMLTSSLFIRSVVFVNPSIYDYDIEKTINQNIKKYAFLSKLNISVNDLNKKLRSSYPHFAYIGVRKVGAKLIVETIEETIKNDNLSVDFTKGDVISKYDAYITGVESRSGVLLIQTSQSVKKGELLISGNLNYLSNPTDISKLVRADGIILGRVAIYEIIRVDKVVEELKYSSNIKEKYELKLFNKNVIKEEQLDYSYTVYNDIFTINNIIAFNKVVHFKQEKVITVYNYESAKSYAYSKIIYNFNLVKCHKNEKIFYIDFIDYKETDSHYEFRFLTSYNRNIGTFIKYD